ncbi:threonylcarbamoyl-AMP synthase [Candidatus Bipolaricaulota bacterium]|nr:threonylcarbamoyl-AMP synthase [Candidatus Bipolaricaulota bacterium]
MLSYNHPDTMSFVHVALEMGQTLIFPTDTVYGLGGNPWDERTLNHVRRLKDRTADQPFTLHLSSVESIYGYADCTPQIQAIIEQLLPGPYTLLLPAGAKAPSSAVSEGKIGIRVPDHPFFACCLRRPVFATSVNRHGEPPLNDVSDIIESFSEVDLIITGEVSGESSAIIDLTQTPYRVLRGSLTEAQSHLLEQE